MKSRTSLIPQILNKQNIYEQLKTDVRIHRNIQFGAHLTYTRQGKARHCITKPNNIRQQHHQQYQQHSQQYRHRFDTQQQRQTDDEEPLKWKRVEKKTEAQNLSLLC